MKIDIVTIFPEYFAPLEISLLGKARRAGILDVHVHDLRAWTHDRHRTVDDTPYGGGPGMVMKPTPWGEALDALIPYRASRQPGPRPEEAPRSALPSDRPQDGGASSDPTDAGGLPGGFTFGGDVPERRPVRPVTCGRPAVRRRGTRRIGVR
ncbi:hypothetical protein [Actinomadura madurae]|uniref:hypothetical protein n=1 Tax=Actinomadura madurae TaxID=1993 RepID=UPI0035591A44